MKGKFKSQFTIMLTDAAVVEHLNNQQNGKVGAARVSARRDYITALIVKDMTKKKSREIKL